MFLTDLASDMTTSRDIGIAQGLKEGIEKGRKEGREEIARNALMNGFSIDQIHLITGLDMDTIKKLGASASISL
jgi:predicted transposase/invertase (TIGR01784 family)